MKPFTNGSMLMPENSSRLLFGLIKIASDEAIRGAIKRPISRREYPSKNVLNMFSRARNPVTGKLIRLSLAKAELHYKSALSEQPGSLNLPSFLGKERIP